MSTSTSCTASIPSTPIDEALEALDTVVRAGKARYVGVSNWPAYRVARALGRSEINHFARIDSVQPRYNLLFRTFERDLLPLCEEEGIAVIPYNPLAGGLLTGKHDRAAAPPEDGTRFTARQRRRHVSGALLARARVRHRRSPARPRQRGRHEHGDAWRCRWVLSNPAITSPIIGASRPEQLADSLAAAEKGALPADLKTKLDDMTHDWRAVDAER